MRSLGCLIEQPCELQPSALYDRWLQPQNYHIFLQITYTRYRVCFPLLACWKRGSIGPLCIYRTALLCSECCWVVAGSLVFRAPYLVLTVYDWSRLILYESPENNYIPQTMIIYLNPFDHSRPLQPGTIPQDTIVPGGKNVSFYFLFFSPNVLIWSIFMLGIKIRTLDIPIEWAPRKCPTFLL